MKILVRLLIAAQSLFMILVGLGFLTRPAEIAVKFFLQPVGAMGLATLRADMFGFFVGGSLFALYGAWKARPAPLYVPLVLLGCAITGRIVTFLIDGPIAGALGPALTEVVMIAVLLLGMRTLSTRD